MKVPQEDPHISNKTKGRPDIIAFTSNVKMRKFHRSN
ncbi:unnamed protein product [Nezara viridula]|uniref:Uncharacterized protein n=1 Tax=Nezara viridula TaxID=85310 RepID=A0A9P0HHI5_NEZVI|nr:unnamed protein product [Nezara viridula]